MMRRDLIKKIEDGGAVFIRQGGRHDWYQNPKPKMAQPVPWPTEIKEFVARSIVRKLATPQEG